MSFDDEEESKDEEKPTPPLTFTVYNDQPISLFNTKGTMLNKAITEMSSQGLTGMQNNSKEWVLYNRSDGLTLNVNESMYLSKHHLWDEKIVYPFELNDKLCLAKADDK